MERQSPSQKNTYKVRSMKTDLEPDKKGAPPSNIPIDLGSESKKDIKDDIKPLVAALPKPESKVNFSAPPNLERKVQSPQMNNLPIRPLNPPIPRPLQQNMEMRNMSAKKPLIPIPNRPLEKAPIPVAPSPRLKPIKETPVLPSSKNLEQAKKLPKTKSQKKLPPRRIIALSILAFIIVLFIIGEIWFFFIRPNPEDAVAPPNSFPSPEELLPPETGEDNTPAVGIEIPDALLSYDKTIEVNLPELNPEEISAGIFSAISGVISENSLNRVVFISTQDQKVLDLDTFLTLSGIIIPETIINGLSGSYDLFFLSNNSFDESSCSKAGISTNTCSGPRLGLVLPVKSGSDIDSSVSAWESTMASDLRSILPSESSLGSASFKSASYRGIPIRYKNFPIDTTTIDYALSNNSLLLSTSKTSMYTAIDAIR